MLTTSSYDIEVFHDGGCPLCRREIEMIRIRDKHNRVRFTNIDDASFDPAELGKSYDQLMAQIHGRLPDGTWVIGVETFRHLYRAIGFNRLVALTRLPVVSQLMDVGYGIFAKYRLALTGRCTTETCRVPEKGVGGLQP
jgi:predicted DCC family thiol-disulfide oxidoreductase YuxK